MAKVTFNALTKGFSGMIGRMLVFRRVGNNTIVQAAPVRKAKWSPAQKEQRQRFKEASLYAGGVTANPAMKMAYALTVRGQKGKAAYHAALTDFLNPPEITHVDCTGYTGQPGSRIHVLACDDFKVVSLSVQILAADGTVIESGAAHVQVNGVEWVYTATVENVLTAGSCVKVKARDLPGNETEGQFFF